MINPGEHYCGGCVKEPSGKMRVRWFKRRLFWRTVALAFAVMALAACTRTAVPVDAPGYSGTSVAATELANIGTAAAMQAGEYAAVQIAASDMLSMHQPAGISGEVVGEVAYNETGLRLTSNQTTLGSSRWVEVVSPDGTVGWVNFLNLTEYVPPDLFCADARIDDLIEAFGSALLAQDGNALQAYIHPRRGLRVRIDAWNPEIAFPAARISDLFIAEEAILWGRTDVTEFPIEGTFSETVYPLLADVLAREDALSICNQLELGMEGEGAWPDEYVAVNYYALYRPADEGGNPYDWRTWAVGIEYDGGVPYVAFLVQYRGE